MKYRPDGWRIPEGIGEETPPMAFEAGADAMLEALRKEGKYQPKEWVDDMFGFRTVGGGYLVFIPNDTL